MSHPQDPARYVPCGEPSVCVLRGWGRCPQESASLKNSLLRFSREGWEAVQGKLPTLLGNYCLGLWRGSCLPRKGPQLLPIRSILEKPQGELGTKNARKAALHWLWSILRLAKWNSPGMTLVFGQEELFKGKYLVGETGGESILCTWRKIIQW
jgi:hypothetical protein